ncbi:hypothetical protein N431DRAFT_93431 [Stipitochalara longipes BDJ]|nr:hypothetical protein N431DRAFT_93431 [Stipitochalara longipes BDJ]
MRTPDRASSFLIRTRLPSRVQIVVVRLHTTHLIVQQLKIVLLQMMSQPTWQMEIGSRLVLICLMALGCWMMAFWLLVGITSRLSGAVRLR